MEISKELQILKVLDSIVLDLKEKGEYDIIKKLYEKLLEENIIPPVESIEKEEVFVGSIEGHLLYRFLVAARQSWLKEKYVTDIIGEPFEQGEF
ncbi:MAG: hypothetical protein IJ419_15730 [Agathobacter sp.]|nr:hypothetical protein [Agathobacter sp.]